MKLKSAAIIILLYISSTSFAYTYANQDLLQGIKRRSIKKIEKALKNGADVNYKDRRGNTPLLNVIGYRSSFKIVKLLLKYRANIEAKDKYNYTPLYKAVHYRHLKIIKLLLSKKANIYAKNKYDKTPLLKVIEDRDEKYLKLFVKYGASLKYKSSDKSTYLHIAAKTNYKIVSYLVSKGLNVNAKNKIWKYPSPYCIH